MPNRWLTAIKIIILNKLVFSNFLIINVYYTTDNKSNLKKTSGSIKVNMKRGTFCYRRNSIRFAD